MTSPTAAVGHLVVAERETRNTGRIWYASKAYRQILPLRTDNSASTVFIVDGVGARYRRSGLIH